MPLKNPILIRSAALTSFEPLARSLGIDAARLAAEAGIARAALDDPDRLVSGVGVRWMLEEAARRSGAEDFGLRLSETRTAANLGLLFLLLREESTPRAVLASTIRYIRLHSPGLQLRVEEADGLMIVHLELVGAGDVAARQSVELSLAVLDRTMAAILGTHWHPLEVHFMHDRPRDTASHLRIFGDRLVFASGFNGVVLATRGLDAALPAADPAMADQIRRHLEAMLGRMPQDLPERVRALIRMLLPTGLCTADRVAGTLGTSRRTLHRALRAAGTSFSRLLDEERAELATAYLEAGSRSLAEVSDLLGYAAQSAFSCWFRARFGTAPSRWRTRAGDRVGPSASADIAQNR